MTCLKVLGGQGFVVEVDGDALFCAGLGILPPGRSHEVETQLLNIPAMLISVALRRLCERDFGSQDPLWAKQLGACATAKRHRKYGGNGDRG